MALKTRGQIALMRQAGLVVWEAHQEVAKLIQPGIATADIDAVVEKVILERGGIPLFKGQKGKVPFPASTCISINEEVVHGIPGSRKLQEGDVVSIDIGVKLNGWCGDAAVTYPVGEVDPEVQRLLDVTEGVLRLAIQLIGKKRRWRQVAQEMERYVKDARFAVVETLVGHTIGRELWEPPQVPNYFTSRIDDFFLKPGTVIAVEPMVAMGTKEVVVLSDQWTIVTRDHKPAAHFEHTIAVTQEGVQILTAGPDGSGWALDQHLRYTGLTTNPKLVRSGG
jgi:methionyl aminopeptidase